MDISLPSIGMEPTTTIQMEHGITTMEHITMEHTTMEHTTITQMKHTTIVNAMIHSCFQGIIPSTMIMGT